MATSCFSDKLFSFDLPHSSENTSLEHRMVNASRDHDAAVIRLEGEWRQQRLLGEEEDADRHRSNEEEACAEGSRQAVVGQRKMLKRVLRRVATRRLGAFWAIWWRHCARMTRRQEMLAYIIRSGLVRSRRRYLWRWRDRCRDHAVTVRQQRCDELHAGVHSANRRTSASRLGHTLAIIASRSVHTAWVAWMRFVSFHRRREVVVGKLGRRFHHVGLRDAFRTLCRATAAVAVQESQMQLDDMQRYRDVLAVQVREGKAKHAEVETWLRGEMEGLEQRLVNTSREHEGVVSQLHNDHATKLNESVESTAARQDAAAAEVATFQEREASAVHRRLMIRLVRRVHVRGIRDGWMRWTLFCDTVVAQQDGLQFIIARRDRRQKLGGFRRWLGVILKAELLLARAEAAATQDEFCLAKEQMAGGQLGRVVLTWTRRSKHAAWVSWATFVAFQRRRDTVVTRLGKRMHHFGVRDAFRTLCRAGAVAALEKAREKHEHLEGHNSVLAAQLVDSKSKHAEVETWLRGETGVLEQRLVNMSREHESVLSRLQDESAAELNRSVELGAMRVAAVAGEAEETRQQHVHAHRCRTVGRVLRRHMIARGTRDGWNRWRKWCIAGRTRGRVLLRVVTQIELRALRRSMRIWVVHSWRSQVLTALQHGESIRDQSKRASNGTIAAAQLERVVATLKWRSKHAAWVSWTTFVAFQRRRDTVVMRIGKKMHHFGVRDAFRTLCRATAAVAVQESQMQLDDMQRYRDVLAVQVRESNARHTELEGWLQDETATFEQRLVNASREHDLTVSRLQGEAEDELNRSLSVNQTREETVMGVVEVLQAKLQSLLASARRSALGSIGRHTWQRQVYCAWEQWARLFREARRMAWALRAMLRVRRNQVLSSTSQALGRWRAAWEDDVQKERWWNATTVSSLPWLRRFKNGARGGSFPSTSPHSSSKSSPIPHVAVSGLRLRQDLHDRQVENKTQRIRRMVRLITASHYRSAVRAWRMALARHKVVAKVWGRTRLRRTSNWFHRWVAQTRKEAMGILDVELDTKLLLATQEVDGFKEQMGEWDRLLRGHRFVDKADFLLKRSLRSALHTWRGRAAHIGAAKAAAGMVLRRMGRARVLAALMRWRIVQFHDTRSLRIDFKHLTGSHHETT